MSEPADLEGCPSVYCETESRIPETPERLLFRRQFLLAPKPFAPNEHWSCLELSAGLHLSVHRDLPFASKTRSGQTLVLVGYAIDPGHPARTEDQIVDALLAQVSDIASLLESSAPLSGRWVAILQNDEGTYLLTDPCGFRQVFYCLGGDHIWCASQPELIKADHALSLSTDESLLRCLADPEFARRESAWIGERTIYDGCLHLTPNHYLDVSRGEQVRFYPSRAVSRIEVAEIVEKAASILQATVAGIAGRHDVTFALTAGWDTRVLLAASKGVSADIEYYVDRQGTLPDDHPDVRVPERLAAELGINFVVRDSSDDPPAWFVAMLARNVTGARVLPKTRPIYAKLRAGEKRVNINGNGSEICRNFYDKHCRRDPNAVSSRDLVQLFGYLTVPPYFLGEIEKWRKGLDPRLVEGVNTLDMLYWEQRLGNWGAQYPAEQDIAVEELSPFDCRTLIETLLASPRRTRAAPDYPLYRMLIEAMWPEALSVPINPASRTNLAGTLKRKAYSHAPLPILRGVKRLLRK